MLAVLKYTVFRLALFVGVLAVLVAVGMGRVPALIVAALVSMMLSYLFLRGPRDAVVREIAERVDHRLPSSPSGAEIDAAHEDAAVDALERPTERD